MLQNPFCISTNKEIRARVWQDLSMALAVQFCCSVISMLRRQSYVSSIQMDFLQSVAPQVKDPLREMADKIRAKGGVEWRQAVLADHRVEFFRGKDLAAYYRDHSNEMAPYVPKGWSSTSLFLFYTSILSMLLMVMFLTLVSVFEFVSFALQHQEILHGDLAHCFFNSRVSKFALKLYCAILQICFTCAVHTA